jgi:hypothetical protein
MAHATSIPQPFGQRDSLGRAAFAHAWAARKNKDRECWHQNLKKASPKTDDWVALGRLALGNNRFAALTGAATGGYNRLGFGEAKGSCCGAGLGSGGVVVVSWCLR